MNDSPQQVQEEPQAQLDSVDHNCMASSNDSVIPESVSDTGQSHLPDSSCPIICGIHEMPLAIDVVETRENYAQTLTLHQHPWRHLLLCLLLALLGNIH